MEEAGIGAESGGGRNWGRERRRQGLGQRAEKLRREESKRNQSEHYKGGEKRGRRNSLLFGTTFRGLNYWTQSLGNRPIALLQSVWLDLSSKMERDRARMIE